MAANIAKNMSPNSTKLFVENRSAQLFGSSLEKFRPSSVPEVQDTALWLPGSIGKISRGAVPDFFDKHG